MIKDLIYKARLYYLPYLKQIIAWIYNRAIAEYEKRKFKYTGEANREDEAALHIEAVESNIDVNNLPTASGEEIVFDALTDGKQMLLDILKDFRPHQQNFGKCVAYTIAHTQAFVTARLNEKAVMPDPDFVYMQRMTPPIDNGMYPPGAFQRAITKGVSMVAPDLDTIPALQKYIGVNVEDKYKYTSLPFVVEKYSRVAGAQAKNFDALWNYIQYAFKKYGPIPFQYSIWSYTGFWLYHDFPRATGQIRGRHSIVGITIPVKAYGQRGFFILDSAYGRGKTWLFGKGIRFISENEFRGLTSAYMILDLRQDILEKLDGFETKEKIKKPKKELSFNPYKIRNAKYGDIGEHITHLQKALEFILERKIPGAPSLFYGRNTAAAVLEFQLKYKDLFSSTEHELRRLKGYYFGPQSFRALKKVLEQKGVL